MLRKDPNILYFHSSTKPTQEEQDFALSLSNRVKFRAANVASNGSPEPCDGVAGDVPDEYRKLYPVVHSHEEAIAAMNKLMTAADNVPAGEDLAPSPSEKAKDAKDAASPRVKAKPPVAKASDKPAPAPKKGQKGWQPGK